MKQRAAILSSGSPAHPSSKDITKYFDKQAKLLYATDKRQTKNSPYREKGDIIIRTYQSFRHVFFPSDSIVYASLYIFDNKINSSLFLLKYADYHSSIFEIDDDIIEEMQHLKWSYDRINSLRETLNNIIRTFAFFIEKRIGESSFHNSFDLYKDPINALIAETANAIAASEKRAVALFSSGWTDWGAVALP